jgi:uncharacterized protein YndB with AHSA1/START domain
MSARKNETTLERRSDRELVVTRAFDAPARIVFDAWTKPEYLKCWWAPASMSVVMFACEVDLRVGGNYRYVFGREGQARLAFSGTYRELVPGSRLVCTQLFEQMPEAGEAIVTATFVEHGGKTTLELHQLYASKQALDGAIGSGMEGGMRITFDQLEGLVGELASR